MALINPNSLYSGGQANWDTTPLVKYTLQERAKKAAKNEALDNYFQKLPETINETGVRDKDIEGLHQAIGDMRSDWMRDRKEIGRGNTPQAFNYGKKYRNILGKIQASKNAAKTEMELGKARMSGNKGYMFKGADREQALLDLEKPVWDDTHKNTGLAYWDAPPPPLDLKKHTAELTVKPNPLDPVYQDIPNDKFNRLEVTNKGFSKQDLGSLQLQSTYQLHNNPSFEYQLNEQVKNPAIAAKLAEVYQSNFGKPPETEEDLATAYNLSLFDLTPTQKTVKNLEAINADKKATWLEHNAITDRQHKANIALNKSAQDAGIEINDFYKGINTKVDEDIAGGYGMTRINALANDEQKIVLQAARDLSGDNTLGNDEIFISKNDNGNIEIYKAENNSGGKLVKLRQNLIGNITPKGVNLPNQPSVKEKREVLRNSATPKPTEKKAGSWRDKYVK